MFSLSSLALMLAQYDYNNGAGSDGSAGGCLAGCGIFGCGLVMFLIWAAVLVAVIAGVWKVFTKAGKPGWAAIVPIYNLIILLEIVKRPIWWIVLFFIPLVNLFAAIVVGLEVSWPQSFIRSSVSGRINIRICRLRPA
jgi:hypothetical protein